MENQGNRSLDLCRRTVTTESFIAEAKDIYGDKYDYSKVDYKNRDHQVVVRCPVHGDFKIFAREHLDGKGCPKCAKGEKFIQKLQEKFGDKFLLDKFVYESSTSPVELICPKHGSFLRLPSAILATKCGCPECGNELNRQLQEQAHAEAEERKAELQRQKEEEHRHLCEISQYGISVQVIDGKKIIKGDRYTEQGSLDCAILETHRNSTNINNESKIFFHVWYTRFYISDHYEPGMIDVKDDESVYIISIPLNEVVGSKQLIAIAEKKLAELINNGYRPRFFINASYLMNRLEEGDIFQYDDFDSHAGYFFKYVDILSKTNYLDIECHEESYMIKRVDSEGYAKHKRSTSSCCVKSQVKQEHCGVEYILNPTNLPTSFVGIDFETLYSQRVSACSVGLVKYKEGKIVDRYYSLIKPPSEYPGKCGVALTWIHGFTEKMLERERTFAEILPEIEAFAEGLPLVAHNASVERACIKETSDFYHLETSFDCENIIDTYPLSRRVELTLGICEEGRGTHSLDAVCRRFGIPEMSHHNALDDAEMCGNLFLALSAALDGLQPMTSNESVTYNSDSEGKKKILPEDKIQRTDLDSIEDNPFKGKNVVLTGFDRATSQEYAHRLQLLGAIVRDQVSGKTKILVTGPNAGPSKIQKCQALGAEIISEEDFLEIVSK